LSVKFEKSEKDLLVHLYRVCLSEDFGNSDTDFISVVYLSGMCVYFLAIGEFDWIMHKLKLGMLEFIEYFYVGLFVEFIFCLLMLPVARLNLSSENVL